MCRTEIQIKTRSRIPTGRERGLKILAVWVRIPSGVPVGETVCYPYFTPRGDTLNKDTRMVVLV